jgi:hypothetical protein
MAYSFHNLNFPQDALLIILILDGVLVNDLDGNFLIGECMDSLLHFAKGAFTQGLAEPVVANDIRQGFIQLLLSGDADFIRQLAG